MTDLEAAQAAVHDDTPGLLLGERYRIGPVDVWLEEAGLAGGNEVRPVTLGRRDRAEPLARPAYARRWPSGPSSPEVPAVPEFG